MKDSPTNPTKSSKTPSHLAYHVRDNKNGQKAFWTKIGIAWQHADGNGFNIHVDAVPLNGWIGLRALSEKS